jgi:hypothetical protein
MIRIVRIDEELNPRLGKHNALELVEQGRLSIERTASLLPIVLPFRLDD